MSKMSRREMMAALASAAGLVVLGQQSNASNNALPRMSERHVEAMKVRHGERMVGVAHAKPKFDRGDRVKIKDGTFANMEGELTASLEAKGLVRVELTIFGRPVPVELQYWQIEHVGNR